MLLYEYIQYKVLGLHEYITSLMFKIFGIYIFVSKRGDLLHEADTSR
jgi:hypothetical protein